jgi:hypothetical protein
LVSDAQPVDVSLVCSCVQDREPKLQQKEATNVGELLGHDGVVGRPKLVGHRRREDRAQYLPSALDVGIGKAVNDRERRLPTRVIEPIPLNRERGWCDWFHAGSAFGRMIR